MRISDWSSDGCSSDLISRRSLRCLRLAGYGLTSDQQPNQGRVSAISTKDCWFQDNLPPNSFIGMICGRALRRFQIQSIDAQYRFELCHTDRKRVVLGKRVSVRGGIGGRRFIKKKKTQK